jgi:hypothetical protein
MDRLHPVRTNEQESGYSGQIGLAEKPHSSREAIRFQERSSFLLRHWQCKFSFEPKAAHQTHAHCQDTHKSFAWFRFS